MMCSQCGKDHADDLGELAFRRPDALFALSAEEREHKVRESNDWCVIAGERFFLRALLPLAVAQMNDSYCIGIWVELQPSDFERVCELWRDEGQAGEPPFAVRLANSIANLPETLGLEGLLQLSGPTSRPSVTLSASSHPLAVEQANGISLHRAHEYSVIFA
ncbi:MULTISPECIES: DUF2199 domain-containing protein [Pseudomonas]|uniref:DUF2199 domain-containing protein n=1 Tax=Pseudomonas donghuensis TaxID=1163398 RepID=A0AAP0SJW7_9PSED|nr:MULTISPECIES: DUF2199 domain-containing protein [Pseudomonas]MDF9893898.1 hypothetical protein [Pseudomonas vranovensis]KDO00043.1 DUF2199 domain-containing protein [Pseudomonas donghuensis]MBF4209446.1 DUF2199 domain-containing protein [Pseudomonas donghuensis]MBS7601461.1 DUF2199 domain-containing protein [Pseudomonas sp. RC2C2]MCP6694256.1 DUF2199 domain-containing protein [Pseudomonas donghuensis]